MYNILVADLISYTIYYHIHRCIVLIDYCVTDHRPPEILGPENIHALLFLMILQLGQPWLAIFLAHPGAT